MQKPNTKLHWGAFLVAQYYKRFGTACRVRDLYPYAEEVFEVPDRLSVTLANLHSRNEQIGRVKMVSETNGGGTRTYAYYPTKITIEELRDLGVPTELPNHDPIPEEYTLELPTERVDAGETPELPERGVSGLSYNADQMLKDYKRKKRSEYTDTEEPVANYATDEEEQINQHECDECDATFSTQQSLAAHMKKHDTEAVSCPDCGKEYKGTHGLSIHIARSDCEMPTHESEEGEDTDTDETENSLPEHDLAYMDEVGLPAEEPQRSLSWADVSNRLYDMARAAEEAGHSDMAHAYDVFASHAMENHLNQEMGQETQSRKLTKRYAQILLGNTVGLRSIGVESDQSAEVKIV